MRIRKENFIFTLISYVLESAEMNVIRPHLYKEECQIGALLNIVEILKLKSFIPFQTYL